MLCKSELNCPGDKFDQYHSLFDMDGTLVDSTAGVIGAWETFAETYSGLDIPKILSSE
jgi:glycerol 3-phosphatase-1